MKTVVILDSELNSTHAIQAVLDRRGFLVLRAGTTEEAINLLKSAGSPLDLVILEVPLTGSASQTEAAVRIHGACPEIPILLVSDLSLDRWPEDDFAEFGKFLGDRVDLLVKPLSQASLMAKVNALIYTVTYRESRRLFENAVSLRHSLPLT